jgi:hypothetical protein
MNEIYERKRRLTISALVHYIERLKKLERDDDISHIITEPLLTSLTIEQSDAEKIISHIKEKGFGMKSDVGTTIFENYSPMKNTLTAALLCYYQDMVESLETASKKLRIGSGYSLLDKEIKFCEEFLTSLAKQYGMNTNI